MQSWWCEMMDEGSSGCQRICDQHKTAWSGLINCRNSLFRCRASTLAKISASVLIKDLKAEGSTQLGVLDRFVSHMGFFLMREGSVIQVSKLCCSSQSTNGASLVQHQSTSQSYQGNHFSWLFVSIIFSNLNIFSFLTDLVIRETRCKILLASFKFRGRSCIKICFEYYC